jgi:hypothetical protein
MSWINAGDPQHDTEVRYRWLFLRLSHNKAMIIIDPYNGMTKPVACIALKIMWKEIILGGVRQHRGIFIDICSPIAPLPPAERDLLIIEATRSHSDTPQSVGLLWTSDRPAADTSTWQHTQHSQQMNIHDPIGIRTRNPSNLATADSRLIPYGHRDRPFVGDTEKNQSYQSWYQWLMPWSGFECGTVPPFEH